MASRLLPAIAGALGLVILVSSGCGSGGPPLGEVAGTVTLDGEPLAGVTVQFDPSHTRPASGVTDSQGRYSLSFIPGTEGAPVGENVVRIYPRDSDDQGNNLADSEIVGIPAKYNEESELTVTVESGSNTFDFNLTTSQTP